MYQHYDFFITGGSSPIGRFFIQQLQRTFPSSRIATSARNPEFALLNIDVVPLDLADNENVVLETLNFTCDHIIHIASCTPGNSKTGKIEEYLQTNVLCPTLILDHLIQSGAKSVFYFSSTAVYNRFKGSHLLESSEKTTTDFYGLSKLLFEQNMQDLSHKYSINALGLRVPVLLTKGVQNNFIAGWKHKIENNEPISGANPDAPFNAVCPDWALFESYLSFQTDCFQTEGSPRNRISNIFASQSTTLGEVLTSMAISKVSWAHTPQKPQTIGSTAGISIPAYSAFQEIYKFFTQ